MALKKCKECGNEISTKADKCPNCGAPVKKGHKGLAFFIIAIFAIIIIGQLSDFSKERSKQKDIQWQAKVAERKARADAKRKEIEKKKNLEYFNNNKPMILAEITDYYDSGNYQQVVISAKKYLDSGDSYVKGLYNKAKHIIDEAAREKEARQRLAAERKKKIDQQFSIWDGSHRNLEKHIKEIMHDPGSYDHVETVYFDKGDHLIVRTTFRGKNAFGAVVKSTITAKVSLNGGLILGIID